MRKIVVFNMVTVDGYFAGPNGDVSWHNVDNEFNEFAIEQTKSFDALIFGRVTYELMASYWPTPAAIKDDPTIANIMNSISKIVFSKSIGGVKETDVWKNVKSYKEINPDEIRKLKNQEGNDIAIFGSGQIVKQFANLGLIDEYRLMVNPVILGKGKALFQDVNKTNLKLKKTRTFGNGNVLLTYEV